MKNNTTELVFILDRSGSMAGLEADTIGGFNAMIQKQKDLPGKVFVSTVLFNNYSKVLHDRKPIDRIKPLTKRDYTVSGCTALLDAMGDAINHIKNIHKYSRKEDVPEHTMFVITTDGMENASTKYDSDDIKKMVKYYTTKFGWEFLFVAANIDAVETAKNIGIREDRAANYQPSSVGTERLYSVVTEAVCNLRINHCIDEDWDKGLN